ncbi:ADP-ribosylglycohydrolase family protein [Mesobacillus maritimus]|uniref:ADP-ribosylglycohydrolase family protein n=1 Tax=Mesobacillus maritimus TaxID=1643336 RepID=UPI00203E5B88|nr:ADP-ribosylglycohydrolase family protein [Mesobacillus maritimus]MCM3588392.1 ADP-ribosylglycohydrolase family protein [Mesobacillus maritimus]
MKHRLKDAIYGLAVADALGVPYEFKQRGTYQCTDMIGYGTWNQPKGTWSDDTSMTIATCKSIKDKQQVDPEDIMENFKLWYRKAEFTPHHEVFDIGATTQYALSTGKGVNDLNANGNGSLMRILPLAFTACTEEEIREVSSLTHAHEWSTKACVIYVTIAKKLLNGENIDEILRNINLRDPYNRLPSISELRDADIKSTGFVVDTLEAALWCITTTNSYQESVLKAVNLGSDTDTVAAVAGGLAVIMYGIENIPNKWIEELANKELINECLF